MHELNRNPSRIEQRKAILETAFQPNGVLHDIAKTLITEQVELLPDDVADVLLPPKQPGDKYDARWELVADTPEARKAAVEAHKDAIYALAEQLDMKQAQSLSDEELRLIDAEHAIWMVEGGANRTSVVRREVALQSMIKLFGPENLEDKTIYQFGSDREIPETRADGSPNPEYAIAKEIGGTYIHGTELTEFGLNIASALQSGYQLDKENSTEQIKILAKPGVPRLVLVQPKKVDGGLRDGFTALLDMSLVQEGSQFVIATNGQYRPKDEVMAAKWAEKYGVELNLQPPVAIGDEPGFTVTRHAMEQTGDEKIVTAARAPLAYLNEVVVLQRVINE